MNSIDANALLGGWLERFELIKADVQELLARRLIFQRLREIVAANVRLHRPSSLYDYLESTYAASATIGVRRHLRQDDRRRDASLIGLLFSLRRNPQVLNRRRHVELYRESGMPEYIAEEEFDRVAGPREPHLLPKHIQPDIDIGDAPARPQARGVTGCFRPRHDEARQLRGAEPYVFFARARQHLHRRQDDQVH